MAIPNTELFCSLSLTSLRNEIFLTCKLRMDLTCDQASLFGGGGNEGAPDNNYLPIHLPPPNENQLKYLSARMSAMPSDKNEPIKIAEVASLAGLY